MFAIVGHEVEMKYMKESLKRQLQPFILRYDWEEANFYEKEDVTFVKKDTTSSVFNFIFSVKDLYSHQRETVKFYVIQQRIVRMRCTCRDFLVKDSCEHIPAVIKYYEPLLLDEVKKDVRKVSQQILSLFSKEKSSGVVKKKLTVAYYFEQHETYWGETRWILKIKLGDSKLYTLGNKYSRFMDAYTQGVGEVSFGKNFTYNPRNYYFSDEDEEILAFLQHYCSFRYGDIDVPAKFWPRFLSLFLKKDFYINSFGPYHGFLEEMPIKIALSKEKSDYILKLDLEKEVVPLTENYEYILYQNKAYHLNQDYRKFLKTMEQNNMDSLIFSKKDLHSFSEGILPIVKNEVEVSEDLKEISIIKKPDVKLYFDLNREDVTCKIKLGYAKQEIDYFAKEDEVLRDMAYEKEVIQDLSAYGFELDLEKNKIQLEGLESVVLFLEEGLEGLASKYTVFTSEKMKNTNVRKNLKITSTFSIGQDNIMRYDFDLGEVDNSEISGLMSALKHKKKYHKLSSGDIVNLEDESLNELRALMENLDLDMKSSSGEIPKYQAIYLDSIKEDSHLQIKTNNLFDAFIKKFREYKDVKLSFTAKEKELLREYQQVGVSWLYTIHKCDLGGILADEMGLGKSIQTIYLFKKLLKEDKDSKFLIVCPTALVYNWWNEFQKFGKEIPVSLFVGNKCKRKSAIQKSKASVFITSYGTLREDIEEYSKMNFKICVIDEAQNIKNPLAKSTRAVKKIQAETKLALTGTPLENSIAELWSIFDFIMPGFLSNLKKFNEHYRFQEMNDDASKQLSNLSRLISPFILRRKKEDVLKELPPKIENNIYIDLGEEQKKLYALEIKKVKEEMEKVLETESFQQARFYILQLLMRLRQLCIDPRLVYENYKGESAKIENLVRVVKEVVENGHKILLFTSFKSALEIVRKEFSKQKISYYTMDGSVSGKMRQELVDKFNKDDTNVFLITLKSGGTGLNLTSADVVIHLDLWWNPQAEKQATDRAHRIGQKKTVEIIKLIATGTIEERILELQKKKQALSDKLIEKDAKDRIELSTLTEKDIKNLLKYENEDA